MATHPHLDCGIKALTQTTRYRKSWRGASTVSYPDSHDGLYWPGDENAHDDMQSGMFAFFDLTWPARAMFVPGPLMLL